MSLSQHRRPVWYTEVPLLVVGFVAFGLIRDWVDRGDPAATNTALAVQRLERTLGIAVEYPLNHALVGQPVAIYLSGYFYRLCVLAVPAILVWLYLSRSERYNQLRTVLAVTMLFDLLLVWLFPESPPRFAQDGIVDHMAVHDILGGATAGRPHAGAKLSAAMPSMHIAWTTWCAYAAWSVLRRGRWLVWGFPLLTALVVLVTGHHYVLDILAGVALVAISVGLTKRIWPANHKLVRRPERTVGQEWE
jgi:membrane-associated phospholipid phosphatase